MFVAGIIKAILNASRFVSQPMHALSLNHSLAHTQTTESVTTYDDESGTTFVITFVESEIPASAFAD